MAGGVRGGRKEGGGGLRRTPAAIPRGIPHQPSGRYRPLANCPPPFYALTPCLRGDGSCFTLLPPFPPDGHPPSPPTATPHQYAHRSAAITRPSLPPGRLTHRRFTDFPRGASAHASPSVSRIPGRIPQFPVSSLEPPLLTPGGNGQTGKYHPCFVSQRRRACGFLPFPIFLFSKHNFPNCLAFLFPTARDFFAAVVSF